MTGSGKRRGQREGREKVERGKREGREGKERMERVTEEKEVRAGGYREREYRVR